MTNVTTKFELSHPTRCSTLAPLSSLDRLDRGLVGDIRPHRDRDPPPCLGVQLLRELLARLEGGPPAAGRQNDPVNRKFLRPPSDGLQNGQRIGGTLFREIATGNL